METPVADFVRAYVQKDSVRLHMPGHKGRPFLGPEPWDITEIPGADSLYEAEGILAESEANAASLFGAGRTLYSAEGSSQCIRAMVRLAISLRASGTLPVIAAGGIADGRGMAAAFMLGAKGIQMGTVFAASKESVIHENYKNSILKAKDIDSRVTGRSTGHPIRVLRNDMARKYLELEKSGAPFEELEQLTLGSLRKAVQEGDTKNGSLMAGQIAGMIKEERTCADIISSTVSEACKLMNGVSANE